MRNASSDEANQQVSRGERFTNREFPGSPDEEVETPACQANGGDDVWGDEDIFRKIDEKVETSTRRGQNTENDQFGNVRAKRSYGRDEAPRKSVSLEIDRLCLLYENLNGTVRFRVSPPSGATLQNIELTVTNGILGNAEKSFYLKASGSVELLVGFRAMKAGSYPWNVSLSYIQNGLRHEFCGQVPLVVEASNPRQTVVNVINNITATGASDVHANTRLADGLQSALDRGEAPTSILRKLAFSNARAWYGIELCAMFERGVLPKLPPEAVADRIVLELGVRRLKLFALPRVVFGRLKGCDIFLRPVKADCSEMEKLPYRKISGHHCYFESSSDDKGVRLVDGGYDEELTFRSSSYGTFWNDGNHLKQIQDSHVFHAGDEGVLSFSLNHPAIHRENCVSLKVKACSPEFACNNCPYSNRDWCGDGRPSLALTRCDGKAETFVCMMSCLHLGEIDRAYDKTVIFRKNGAFAWCRGDRCGWLVPGETITSEYGSVKVTRCGNETD